MPKISPAEELLRLAVLNHPLFPSPFGRMHEMIRKGDKSEIERASARHGARIQAYAIAAGIPEETAFATVNKLAETIVKTYAAAIERYFEILDRCQNNPLQAYLFLVVDKTVAQFAKAANLSIKEACAMLAALGTSAGSSTPASLPKTLHPALMLI